VPDTPAADFVPYGYVYAMVEVRGTGSSGGSFELLGPREVEDDGQLVMPWHPLTRASETPVAPGELERHGVELPGTVARIPAGHRIRVTVQSSYAPYLEPTFPDQSQLWGGSYAVARGGPRPSAVTVPIVAPGDLATSSIEWGPCVTDCGQP
jgi:uncharacterized protein